MKPHEIIFRFSKSWNFPALVHSVFSVKGALFSIFCICIDNLNGAGTKKIDTNVTYPTID